MKRALIVLGNYFPNPSSVANCMNPLIDKLSDKFLIDILTDRKKIDIPEYERKKNISIYRVDDYRTMNTIYSNEMNKINSSYFLKLMTKIFTIILKTAYYIRYVMFSKEQGTGGWSINRVYNKAIELDDKYNYDVVFSISQPFQSHYVAEKVKAYKGENIKWIVFEFDPFSFNNQIKASTALRKRMHVDEKRIFEKSDCVILTPELYDYYKKKQFIKMDNKIFSLSFANFEQIKINETNVSCDFMERDKINCLFTGQLYDKIRDPGAVLEIFSQVDDKIKLHMMTNFSEEKISSYINGGYTAHVIPFQNRDTALYNLMKADILINIGNTVEHQVPGKIFEYMSTGRPIIHFSKIKNDPAVKYLKKYPEVLIIEEWETDSINYVDQVENFCEKNKNYRMSFEEVNEYLGEYSGKAVQDRFFNIINEMLGDK